MCFVDFALRAVGRTHESEREKPGDRERGEKKPKGKNIKTRELENERLREIG